MVGFTSDGDPVTAEQLRGAGAMTVIMRDAIQPIPPQLYFEIREGRKPVDPKVWLQTNP